jgi:hypothetical protein
MYAVAAVSGGKYSFRRRMRIRNQGLVFAIIPV